jgi:hypothetical protein
MVHDLPFSGDDAIAEAEALCNGPSYSENPAEWPAWCDDWCYEPTEAPPVVDQADIEWLNNNPVLPPIAGGAPEPFEPSDQDWDDLYVASYGIGDDDLRAGGLPVG